MVCASSFTCLLTDGYHHWIWKHITPNAVYKKADETKYHNKKISRWCLPAKAKPFILGENFSQRSKNSHWAMNGLPNAYFVQPSHYWSWNAGWWHARILCPKHSAFHTLPWAQIWWDKAISHWWRSWIHGSMKERLVSNEVSRCTHVEGKVITY